MTQKSYTPEDEEFVRFVRTQHTITETAQLSGLSESTVKRILAKSRPDEPNTELRPDELTELKSMIEKQNATIKKLMDIVTPRKDYEDAQPVTRLVLGRK